VPSYAIAPATGRTGRLVLYLNGTGGTPAGSIAGPTTNVYNSIAALGHHVLALSYRSSQALASLCFGDDPCFLPTRITIVTGVVQPGSASAVAGLQPTEGIEPRLVLALRALATLDPGGGWDAFLDGGAVRWPSVIVTGHSQGGGHAAALAKLHPLERFVALSAPCDMVANAAASWLHPDASWPTPPSTRGYGFSAPTLFDASGAPVSGDLNCPAHAATWDALGLDPSRRFDDATLCGGNPHGAPIGCATNFPRVAALFALDAE
jgi:hypothetical protein